MSHRIFAALCAAGLGLVPYVSAVASDNIDGIKEIVVSGTKRIPTDTIATYFPIKIGSKCDEAGLDEGIKKLFALGVFDDVRAECSGSLLTIKVVESPVIYQIGFEGNKTVRGQQIKKHLDLAPGKPFKLAALHRDLNVILHLYQHKGLQNVLVDPKLVKLSGNRVSIVYKIQENSKAKIHKINFVGNEVFNAADLQNVIASRPASFFRIFSSLDLYDSDRIERDKSNLEDYYFESGYPDFKVVSAVAEFNRRKGAFVLTFTLNEGSLYKFGQVRFENNLQNVSNEELLPLVSMKSGTTFKRSEIEIGKAKIEKFLGDKGYAFAKVEYDIVKDKKNHVADVVYKIAEGYKFYINKINIKGNTRTTDEVIRRTLRIAEGEGYTRIGIERSKYRLEGLDYFSSAELTPRATNVFDKVDVEVEVKEKPTGSANLRLSYSGAYGAGIGLIFNESNLLGTGRNLQLAVQKAQRDFGINIGIAEPNFMRYDVIAGAGLFYNKQVLQGTEITTSQEEEQWQQQHGGTSSRKPPETQIVNTSYITTKRGGNLNMTYELNDHLYHTLEYLLKSENISGFSQNTSAYLKALKGSTVTSMARNSVTYDRRNNVVNPTSGYVVRGSFDVAGLAGSNRFIQPGLYGAYYYPIYKQDVVLQVVARAGLLQGIFGKGVSLLDNYHLGQSLVRGFDVDGIGPRAYSIIHDNAGDREMLLDPLGGKYYYAATAEVNFPIGLPRDFGVFGAVFHDCGNLWGVDAPALPASEAANNGIYDTNQLRASVGFGLIWHSPQGVIRVDYGVPYLKAPYDQTCSLRITMGSTF